jgi:hypothetical protein
VDRDRLTRGFTHLVVKESVLEQVGPAVNAGKAVFLTAARQRQNRDR